MRICLHLAYDGTDFCGWQKQHGRRTVAGTAENVLKKILREEITLKGAARTDKGVHALCQVVHFDCAGSHIPPENIAAALNRELPFDIKVLKSFCVPESFHARLSATGKTYLYKLYISDIHHPLYHRTHHIVLPPFDIEKAQDCLFHITGTHDFTSFCYADKEEKENKIRTITKATARHEDQEVYMEITGEGFLHNMVRIIVGTVVRLVKSTKHNPADMRKILIAQDRQKAYSTAPACGLYLKEVFYS